LIFFATSDHKSEFHYQKKESATIEAKDIFGKIDPRKKMVEI